MREIIGAGIPLLGVLLGGIITWAVGWQTSRVQLRKDARVNMLKEAYFKTQETTHGGQGLQEAVDVVFLLGTPRQVDLLMVALSSRGSLNPLLLDIRAELRRELGLEPDPQSVVPHLTEPSQDRDMEQPRGRAPSTRRKG